VSQLNSNIAGNLAAGRKRNTRPTPYSRKRYAETQVVKTIDQRIEALKTVTDIDSEVEAMLRFDEELLEKFEQLAREPAFAPPRARRGSNHRR
jgi:hypothetical protein